MQFMRTITHSAKMSKPQVPAKPHGASDLRDKTNQPNIETNMLQNSGEYIIIISDKNMKVPLRKA